MRAVRFDRYGGLEVLEVREVPDPVPGPGQVRVRVKAAGINPGEIAIREGAFAERWPSEFPEGEGSDLAGIVDAVGDGVTSVAVGDEVIGFVNNRRSHAELVIVDSDVLAAKPAELPWEVAGGLFVAGTSGRALVDAARVGKGDTVAVSSAAGGTGVFASQLARAAGARVIGLASSENHEFLVSLGVEPLDYHGDGLADRIRSLAPGGVDALLDTHGAPYVDLGLELGVPADRIATLADFSAGAKGAVVVSHSVAARADVLADLAAAIVAGELTVPIAATYPLDRVRDAYEELARRATRGKIVLLP